MSNTTLSLRLLLVCALLVAFASVVVGHSGQPRSMRGDVPITDTIPQDTIPQDTIPQDTIPQDTIPQDTIPQDTIPQDTTEAWTFTNFPVDLTKDSLKVLDLGNSYTNDATSLLKKVATAAGADMSRMCLYTVARGSSSFSSWVNNTFAGIDSVDFYRISKSLGDINLGLAEGSHNSWDTVPLMAVLRDVQWDLIVVHQVSSAVDYDQWVTHDSVAGYINEFLQLLRRYQPTAAIGTYVIHSYSSEYSKNTQHSTRQRWEHIAQSTQRMQQDYGLDFVVPYGTAIENLRLTTLNNEYDLTRDSVHLGFGLARYAAACTYYQTLLAPRTGKSVLGNGYRHKCSATEIEDALLEGSCINVTETNARIAQKAAYLACLSPYTLTNPEYLVNQSVDLTRDSLKVLEIGNEHTRHATSLLDTIARAAGGNLGDMCFYTLTRDSASFHSWNRLLRGEVLPVDSGRCVMTRAMGALDLGKDSLWQCCDDSTLIMNVMRDVNWDLILIHPSVEQADDYNAWLANDTATGDLRPLLEILRTYQPDATIGATIDHSLAYFHPLNETASTLQQWKDNVQALKQLAFDYSIDFMVPYGTAIENLRTTSINNETDLTSDGAHLAAGAPRYTAACTYYQALVAPRTGATVLCNPVRVTCQEGDSTGIDLTDDNALQAQRAAMAASLTPFAISTYTMANDVNCDARVSMSDVTVLIELVLGEIPSTYDPEAADVNRDSTVSMSDVTMLIDIILNH